MAVAGVFLGGCGTRPRPVPPPPPAEPAYVSLERLARQHPLWNDLQRLEATARRLEKVSSGGNRRGGGSNTAVAAASVGRTASAYILPELALPAAPQGSSSGAALLRQMGSKGETHRVQLARRLQRLRDRELKRRRGHLEAASDREQARRARELLEGVNISARFRQILEQISEDPANEVIKKVAPPPPNATLLGADDRKPLDDYAAAVASVRSWIAALTASLNLGLIPETRTVLENRLVTARGALSELIALEQQARRQAELEAAAVLEQAARQDRSRIDREIAGLRTRYKVEIAERVQREQARLNDDLAMVQRLSRTLKTTAGDETSARPYVVPVPIRGSDRNGLTAQAAARVREQRDRLGRFLHADVQAAVRDIAVANNIQVSFNRSKSGMPDRTEEFARWIGYGSQGTGERKK